MENEKEERAQANESPQPIENNYEAHKENPGPPIEAVTERNKDGAGKMLKYIIPLLVLILFIVWLIVKE